MGVKKSKRFQTCNKRNKQANKAEMRFLIGNGGKAVQEMFVWVLFLFFLSWRKGGSQCKRELLELLECFSNKKPSFGLLLIRLDKTRGIR